MRPCSAARSHTVLSILLLCGLFVSCGSPSRPMQIAIVPVNPALIKGAHMRLRATGIYQGEITRDLSEVVTWAADQPFVARIDANGEVTGVGEGVAQVSASYEGVKGNTAVTVHPPALLTITVSPNPSSLPAGESEPFTAKATFSDGSSADLTPSATWTSSESTIASISSSGTATARAIGTTTITATSGSVSGSASLTVIPAVMVAMSIMPSSLSIPLGTSSQLQAVATMSDGTQQSITGPVAWQASPPAVATITVQGTVTGVGKGVAQVSASYQTFAAGITVTVGPPALVSIAVSPNPFSLPLGESQQFTATGTFSDKSVQDLTHAATWASSAPTIATVNPAGTAIAGEIGTTSISATLGSVSGYASLTVNPAAVTGLNIVPATLSVVLGSSRQLQAIATMSDGSTKNMTATVTWGVAQPEIARISSHGMATAMQIGSTTIFAQNSGVTASAGLTVIPLMALNYFDRASATQTGIDAKIRLVNPGVSAGDICAMVYVFDQSQELNECCGCRISDSGLRTLSLLRDLTANPLTGKKPNGGSIKVVPSDPAQNPQCDPGSLAPTGEIVGWETHPQVSGGTSQITETSFDEVPLGSIEAAVLVNECGFVEKLGSGKGICSCGTGD